MFQTLSKSNVWNWFIGKYWIMVAIPFGTGYLDIWTFGPKMNCYTHTHPVAMSGCSNWFFHPNFQISKYLGIPKCFQIHSKCEILWFLCKKLKIKSACLGRLFFFYTWFYSVFFQLFKYLHIFPRHLNTMVGGEGGNPPKCSCHGSSINGRVNDKNNVLIPIVDRICLNDSEA